MRLFHNGWQFPGKDVFMLATQGARLNCFAFLQRNNQTTFEVKRVGINSQFIFEQFERLSMRIKKLTVVVLDNDSGSHRQDSQRAARGCGSSAAYFYFICRDIRRT